MTYLDRSGEARDGAVRRARIARSTLIASAAVASVGLAGAIGAGAANAQKSSTPNNAGTGTSPPTGTDDRVAHIRNGTHAARLRGQLKNFGTKHALTTGSGGPSHAKSSGS